MGKSSGEGTKVRRAGKKLGDVKKIPERKERTLGTGLIKQPRSKSVEGRFRSHTLTSPGRERAPEDRCGKRGSAVAATGAVFPNKKGKMLKGKSLLPQGKKKIGGQPRTGRAAERGVSAGNPN